MRQVLGFLAASAVIFSTMPAVNAGASSQVPAGACRFDGGDSQDPSSWFKSANWSCGYVPDATTTVVIDTYVRAEGEGNLTPGDPCFITRGCTARAKDVYIEPGGELSSTDLVVSGVMHLQGSLFCEQDTPWCVESFDIASLIWESGTIATFVEAGSVIWHGGFLNGQLKTDSVTMSGEGQTRISQSLKGKLVAKDLTFGEPSVLGAEPVPLEIIGDGVGLVTERAVFTRKWSVEGWGDAPVWDAGSVRVIEGGVDALLWDVDLQADAIGVGAESRLQVAGGSLTPTVAPGNLSGGRSYLGCNLGMTGCTSSTVPDQGSAGRLETGVAPWGSTGLWATEIRLPARWALRNVVWAHWSGVVAPASGVSKASVEPFNPRATSASNAWFEWFGGSIDRAIFPGGGPARSDYGVDIDILGGSTAPVSIKRLKIGSDAVLATTDAVYVDCSGSLTIAPSGTMTQYAGTYLGGCNDGSTITNGGNWAALAGPQPARLAETAFTSTGTVDLRDGSLEVSDLYSASIRGSMVFSWETQAQMIVSDSSRIALGASRKPLTTVVEWGAPGPVADDYFMGILSQPQSSSVTGYVRSDGAQIAPGLLWVSRLDPWGLILEAQAGNTITSTLSGCSTRACSRSVTKNAQFTLTWTLTASAQASGVGVTIILPSQVRFVSATGMTCSSSSTLSCSVGTVGPSKPTRVSVKLMAPRVGVGLVRGSLAGRGLVGDLSLPSVTVTVR